MVGPRQANHWNEATLAHEKRIVKTELDAPPHGLTPKTRLQYVLRRITELADTNDPKDSVRRYIYCMSALVHHERTGGLINSQITNISEMAFSLLKIAGIKTGQRKSAQLYADLYTVLSQIYHNSGNSIRAAWQQQMAFIIAKNVGNSKLGFQKLTTGNRAMRLGHIETAIKNFREAESIGLSDQHRNKCRLRLVRCLRLHHDFKESQRMIIESLSRGKMNPKMEQAFRWEEICIGVHQDKNFIAMAKAISKGSTHDEIGYIFEGKLWLQCSRSAKWHSGLPKASSLSRRTGINIRRNFGPFYDCVVALDEVTEANIPYEFRLRNLGESLVNTTALATIDKELLVWGATARFLISSKSTDLAAIAYNQYKKISNKLTGGKSSDCLGLLSDIEDRQIFKGKL